MRRDEEVGGGPALPLRATGIALGLWVGVLLALAFVAVPVAFAMCTPSPGVP